MTQAPDRVEHFTVYFDQLVQQGGPKPDQDAELTVLIGQVHAEWKAGHLSQEELNQVRGSLQLNDQGTLQGFAFSKPHGYSGDFETIDLIYRGEQNPDPRFFHWDRYWQSQPAGVAVRNRKDYFKSWLSARNREVRAWKLLNLASGPCRDVVEFFASGNTGLGRVRCVDQDEKAIQYGRQLCSEFGARIEFEQANVIRYQAREKYEFLWSAGLFDYLSDDLFVRLLKRFRKWVVPGGEIVIGNFSTKNPTRQYMEVVLDWHLNHRDESALCDLAHRAGFQESQIHISAEPLKINLFLHIRV